MIGSHVKQHWRLDLRFLTPALIQKTHIYRAGEYRSP